MREKDVCHHCGADKRDMARLTRERDEARAEVERLRALPSAEDLEERAHEILDGAGIPTHALDPVSGEEDYRADLEERLEWTVEEITRARADAARLRGALERAERALQGIATAQRFDRDVFSDDSAYVDWARSLSLHVAEIARAALAGEGEAKRCAWTYDEMHFAWDSSCNKKWILMDGGPFENEIRFCHGCGNPVEIACEATPEKARQGEEKR